MSQDRLLHRRESRVVLYVDERTELGKQAGALLCDCSLPVVTVPVKESWPFALHGRRKYNGIEEIAELAASLKPVTTLEAVNACTFLCTVLAEEPWFVGAGVCMDNAGYYVSIRVEPSTSIEEVRAKFEKSLGDSTQWNAVQMVWEHSEVPEAF